ncbi:DUF1634 domain-containing protein [Caldanaerobacter subterraneus]|uniref:Membrane protein n=2 Tax=Caldanaerobacter subterraneus TaxID=911092 RepID=U5CP87_CALSX|nr:DUF1634 domain-containing protein [Caldanaerobacter subterraneus]ERM91798.1 membrane protein [Caldanaerobacter subterraneus subsp. yonseiensis KB-1]
MEKDMKMKLKKENEDLRKMELIISKALSIGVTTSAVVIFLGLLMLVITGNSGYPHGYYPTTPLSILRGFIALKPYAVILTGLLLLILTPVFRVAVSIITFLYEKDYTYTIITTLVFIILIISFLLGKVE